MQIPSLPSEQESRGPDYQQPAIFDGNRVLRAEAGAWRSVELHPDVVWAIKAADALGFLTQGRT